jgi:hypothetical protein
VWIPAPGSASGTGSAGITGAAAVSWRSAGISFAEFDARLGDWINHVRYVALIPGVGATELQFSPLRYPAKGGASYASILSGQP